MMDEKHKAFLNTDYMTTRALFSTFILLFLSAGAASAATITVDDGGGADYTSIQAAVDSANVGDTILVNSGMYYENVIVNKSVNLIGEEANVTIINALIPNDYIIRISADFVNFSRFTITAGVYGIHIISSNNNITDNKILATGEGIYLNGNNSTNNNNNNNITNNDLLNNRDFGIFIDGSSNNYIKGNYQIGSYQYGGIYLKDSYNNTLIENNLFNNYYSGIIISSSNNNSLIRNNAYSNSNHGIYLTGESNANNLLVS